MHTDDFMPSFGAQQAEGTFADLQHTTNEDHYTGEESSEWTYADSDHEGLRRRRPDAGAVRTSADVYALVTSGHSFSIQTFRNPASVRAAACRHCGASLAELDGEWFCEFEEMPITPDNRPSCRCNACVIREQRLLSEAGRPRVICKSAACKRKDNAERQKKYRQSRKALQAA